MKKLLTLALAITLTLGTSAKNSDSNEFSSVKVYAPVHLVITKSADYSVKVFSRNKELTSAIKYTIRDGILSISSNDIESLEKAHGHVTVVVSAPDDIDYSLSPDMQEVKPRVRR